MSTTESRHTDENTGMPIQSISRAMQIIHLLEETTYPLTLGQIAKQVLLPRSTVQRLTNALKQEGIVTTLPGLGLALRVKGSVSCKNRTFNLRSENDSKGLAIFKRYLVNPCYDDKSMIICRLNDQKMTPVLWVSAMNAFAFNLETSLDDVLLNDIYTVLKKQGDTIDSNLAVGHPYVLKNDAASTFIETGEINPYRGSLSIIKDCQGTDYSITIFGQISFIKKVIRKKRGKAL